MCLDMRMIEKEEKEWLKSKPENITAYKVVWEINNKIYPMYYNREEESFQKVNKLKDKGIVEGIRVMTKGLALSRYIPYYHFFELRKDAEKWGSSRGKSEVILKCTIPKDQITAVGWQNDSISIIAKEFTFIEGSEYFKEEKECA